MKTKEELNALKNEVETLNKKLAELSEEELEQVTGGDNDPSIISMMKCGNCKYSTDWIGYHKGRYYTCPKCGSEEFKGIDSCHI